MRLIPTYRPRPTALHSARAPVAALLYGSFVLAALLFSNPVLLAGMIGALLVVAAGGGVVAELRRGALLAVPVAIVIVIVNALVYREGTHVIFRGGTVLGRRLDVTLESVAAGGVAAMRLLVIACAFGVYSAAVDPDQMLRLFRRLSYRSALTGSLATRLAHVLHRDAERMSEAARCRPQPPPRGRVLLAVLGRALDRAVDVAAALEVRGYARASARRPSGTRRPWSRHDVRVALAAVIVTGAAIAGKALGVNGFQTYPTIALSVGPGELAVMGAMLAAAVLPFAGTSGRLGVAHG